MKLASPKIARSCNDAPLFVWRPLSPYETSMLLGLILFIKLSHQAALLIELRPLPRFLPADPTGCRRAGVVRAARCELRGPEPCEDDVAGGTSRLPNKGVRPETLAYKINASI